MVGPTYLLMQKYNSGFNIRAGWAATIEDTEWDSQRDWTSKKKNEKKDHNK